MRRNPGRDGAADPARQGHKADAAGIDKNLAVVQKIAFLLGENAAETEATLNSIMESFVDSGEDQ